MALLLMEGFDAYGVVGTSTQVIDSRWTYYSAAEVYIGATSGRRGGPALRQVQNNNGGNYPWRYIYCNVGVSCSTMILGFAFLANTTAGATPTSQNPLWSFGKSTAVSGRQVCIFRTVNNALEVREPDGVTVLATSADGVITPGTYQYIEIKIVCDAAGSVVVKVDGVEVINQGSINTQDTGSGGIQYIDFRNYVAAATPSYYDDLVIMDGTGSTFNDFIGDVQVAGHLPDADGSHTDWTSTEADQHSAVDDVAAAFDDEYIESATEGHKDSFTITPTGTTPGILAVEVVAHGYNTGGGTAKITPFVIIGGVTYSGTEVAMAAGTSDRVSYTWEKNPATNGLWSRTVLAAAEFGFEVTEIT